MTIRAAGETKIIWEAQPGPQTALIECPVFEVFYGGARGGGKTEGSIGDFLEHQNAYGEGAHGAFFRRNRSDLTDVIERTKQIYPQLGAKFNENKNAWRFANGARMEFEFLERDSDAQKYQGRSYTRIYVEEATQFPSPTPLWKLKATLRSATGVPCGMRLTGNPGGPGHNWVKARYITPNPRGLEIIEEEEELEIEPGKKITVKLGRVFIPSKVWDNKLLLANDPTYLMRLRDVGSEALVKAWLQGDWDIIEGAFFDEWNDRHILDTQDWLPLIPRDAMRFRAFDWGSEKPFSVGWYAVADGDWQSVNGVEIPRGALVKYREWYGAKGPNKGLKMTAELVAKGVREREIHERIRYGVADPSIFIRNGGPSIAEMMAVQSCMWRAADNKRVPGWQALRSRLVGNGGAPMLYFLDCCEDSIRTIPLLQHDALDAEDVDTEGEDHAGDETRYACMSRPWIPGAQPDSLPEARDGQYTFNAVLAKIRSVRLNRATSHG
jgi:hypothetical protein